MGGPRIGPGARSDTEKAPTKSSPGKMVNSAKEEAFAVRAFGLFVEATAGFVAEHVLFDHLFCIFYII